MAERCVNPRSGALVWDGDLRPPMDGGGRCQGHVIVWELWEPAGLQFPPECTHSHRAYQPLKRDCLPTFIQLVTTSHSMGGSNVPDTTLTCS